jgi:SAM-dependent methyltransferase
VAWSSGDYHAVAARIMPIAERLVEAADLPAGARVLDVAAGSGNAALAAARCGCAVTGLDYVPELLERGRVRAAAEGLPVDFVAGDAEKLPYPDGAFDAVLSCVGVMFAPDQERAAAELVRVCRPGGTIALANWTPASFVGGIFRTVGKHVPPPPGVKAPGLWGTRQRLEELLGGSLSELSVTERSYVFRFRSAAEFTDFFRVNYGPVRKAFEALDEAGQRQLQADLTALAVEFDRGPGPSVAMPSAYLEVVATRR